MSQIRFNAVQLWKIKKKRIVIPINSKLGVCLWKDSVVFNKQSAGRHAPKVARHAASAECRVACSTRDESPAEPALSRAEGDD